MANSVWRSSLRIAPSILAGAGLVLAAVNGVLGLANRALQADVNVRAQYINQSVQLSNLEQALARAAATAAVNNKDTKLGELLERNGIHYQFTPNASAGPALPSGINPAQPNVSAGAAAGKPAGGR